MAIGKPKVPGLPQGPRRHARRAGQTVKPRKLGGGAATVQYPHEKEAPPIRARGVIALHEDNCTACMLCARSLPRLVHLHRGPQAARPAAPRRRQAAPGQQPRPLRHRLRAVHVLRHLRRGVPVRRAVLEPRVRVLRAAHRRPAARQDQARRVDGDRARGARARGRRREEEAASDCSAAADVNVAQNIGFGIIAAVMIFGALRVVTTQERRPRRAVAGGRARPASPRSTSSLPPSSSPSPGARLHRRRDGAVPVRHHAHPGQARRASAT